MYIHCLAMWQNSIDSDTLPLVSPSSHTPLSARDLMSNEFIDITLSKPSFLE